MLNYLKKKKNNFRYIFYFANSILFNVRIVVRMKITKLKPKYSNEYLSKRIPFLRLSKSMFGSIGANIMNEFRSISI